MYNAYDNVFIAALSTNYFLLDGNIHLMDYSYMSNNLGTNGNGSDVFTISYGLDISKLLKGNVDKQHIYQIGADVYQTGEGLELLESGEYLIFANTEENSIIQSGAIPNDGLVILDNSQLIRISDLTDEELNLL